MSKPQFAWEAALRAMSLTVRRTRGCCADTSNGSCVWNVTRISELRKPLEACRPVFTTWGIHGSETAPSVTHRSTALMSTDPYCNEASGEDILGFHNDGQRPGE